MTTTILLRSSTRKSRSGILRLGRSSFAMQARNMSCLLPNTTTASRCGPVPHRIPRCQPTASTLRDIVGELTTAVRGRGMRMDLYYSGGYDWTFVPGPIREKADYEKVKPQSEAYGEYVDSQVRELIARYQPAVLWNDIDYPRSGHPLEIMAEYYNLVPDGVIDDRFGVQHSDFTSPE